MNLNRRDCTLRYSAQKLTHLNETALGFDSAVNRRSSSRSRPCTRSERAYFRRLLHIFPSYVLPLLLLQTCNVASPLQAFFNGFSPRADHLSVPCFSSSSTPKSSIAALQATSRLGHLWGNQPELWKEVYCRMWEPLQQSTLYVRCPPCPLQPSLFSIFSPPPLLPR